jgi:hypothetical protein
LFFTKDSSLAASSGKATASTAVSIAKELSVVMSF